MAKKILFDIIHLCHLNFYKNAILRLHDEGFDIDITYLDRGKIAAVLDKELPGFRKQKIGKYAPTDYGKIWMTVDRSVRLINHIARNRPDLTTGVGDFILALSSRLLGIPSVLFYDDYEFKINYRLSRIIGSILITPYPIPRQKGTRRYNSFKELAYLHPKIYAPDNSIISKMKLRPRKYVFVREVAGISMNYSGLERDGLLKYIRYLHKKGFKVVLSLEDKTRRASYEPFCLVLDEPLEDIYSIMHFASFALSSGDSMARESALLGVPCIYTGKRDMLVNRPFIRWGGIIKADTPEETIEAIDRMIRTGSGTSWRSDVKRMLEKDLLNTTDVIVDSLKGYISR